LRWRILEDVPPSWRHVLLGLRRGADALSVGAQLARDGGGSEPDFDQAMAAIRWTSIRWAHANCQEMARQTQEMLRTSRPKVELLAAALLDRDALDCCEVAAIQKERTQ